MMMRYLKQHAATQTLAVESRMRRLGVLRWLYLASILAVMVWLFNLFFGSLFYLVSDGLVLGEPGAVAAEFNVTVHELQIREGEVVKAGQIAAVTSSQNVAEGIARLAADLATRQGKLSELRVRRHVVDSLLPLAENRQKLAVHAREEFHRLLDSGLTGLNQRTQSVELEYRAQTDLVTLNAEKRVLDGEIANLTAALGEVEKAIGDLRRLYDEGRLRAPIDGVVSRRLASTGSVMRTGDTLFELYNNERFVLAYLPTGALYHLKPGDEIQISTGLRTYRGSIKRIEPYAAALPHEFQRAFTPVDRQQVMRVEFDPGETPPPLFTKVWLKSANMLPGWLERIWRKQEG
jgi:multidrug resistance efflux pump